MNDRGIVIGLIAVLLLSLGLNGYLFFMVQKTPTIVYADAPEDTNKAPVVEEAKYLVVYVSGAVAKSGVYTLPEGSRVHNAVQAAGGALDSADLTRINLARLIIDGEQIHITAEGEAAPVTGTQAGTASSTININTATQVELETLPGIGPAKAQDIIAYRTQNGPFRKIDDITNVKGIGEKTFESLKLLIRVN